MSDNLETSNLEVNIEEIIREIRREIQEKGYKETDLKFEDIPVPAAPRPQPARTLSVSAEPVQGELKNVLDYLNANYEHDIMLPVESSNPAAGIVKKLVRKMVRFLFYPVLARQNSINSSIVNALNILTAEIETAGKSEQMIAELQEKVRALEEELRQSGKAEPENEKN